MFNKILANIASNPSTMNQFAFYSSRLRKEQSIRKLGLFFIIASMFVQIIATMIPAEKSLAYSDNHIINGIKTKQDILQAWDRPGSDIPAIYNKFGVTRQDIINLPNRPNATIRSSANNNYWSIGRNSLSGYTNVDSVYKNQELAISTGGPTVYMRPLHAWDTGSSSSYKAFQGRNSSTGKTFWILVDCGNYTQVGKIIKQEPPKKPVLEAKKTALLTKSSLVPGDSFKYVIEYRNKAVDSLAEDAYIEDQLDLSKYDVLNFPQNATIDQNGKMTYKIGNLKYTDVSKRIGLTLRLKNSAPNGKFCNVAILRAANASQYRAGGQDACITVASVPPPVTPVATPVPPPPTPPTPTPQPTPPPPVVVVPEEETVPPSLSKEVRNVTQNLNNESAIGSSVKAGDVLEYRLTTTNTRKTAIKDHTIKDYVGDLLDYTEIDIEFLGQQGGVFNETTREIEWQNQTLSPQSETEKRFRVRAKNPLPSTNSPSGVTTSFDCKISNQYGDEITLHVACPTVKAVEELPNTGPGATIGAAFALTTFSGYFFARARLLAKESRIIRKIYQHLD